MSEKVVINLEQVSDGDYLGWRAFGEYDTLHFDRRDARKEVAIMLAAESICAHETRKFNDAQPRQKKQGDPMPKHRDMWRAIPSSLLRRAVEMYTQIVTAHHMLELARSEYQPLNEIMCRASEKGF